ncbi:FAD-dependent oxidoreductase (plasmid) [Gemmobacter aquarius]|uniref:FAD-dependent oxidoreductase n=1 Tax=Paragemmobacter aquarius TaxID=2169400 RepID=A0A2S0US43_9RHOB|nr:NAD(P)/FAD-dependent oxidoreductase [Gemmobacter aquarius]AWB50625.1 FAD-dependent oxidoreductase [Gemmobacter aquarius]
MEQVDCTIIGAGVVGLAIARRMALQGREVLILDRASTFGTETSARNSEVIHAGLYYDPNSHKARLCIRGRDLLYAYLRERDLPHRQCGKLIVATTRDQIPMLETIAARALGCGAGALTLIDRTEALTLEPALECHAALLSPMTGILDSHAYMQSLLADAESHGAMLACYTMVTGGLITGSGFVLETLGPGGETLTLHTRTLINAAGHGAAPFAARLQGYDPALVPQTWMARGQYFTCTGRNRFSRLIYPVPEPGGLGIHLTLDLQGSMRFGPDVAWIETLDYTPDPSRLTHFADEISRYWPALPIESLSPSFCGIRPKLSPAGAPAADFRIDTPSIHGVPGLVQLYGIESPGLTASLALAEMVCQSLRGDPPS